MNPTVTADDYFDLMERWLALEGEAERVRMVRRRQIRGQADAERSGETVLGLQIVDHKTGLAGRYLIDLAKTGDKPLPMNRLKVGSPIVLSDQSNSNDQGIAGVVSRRKHSMIQIATDHWPDGDRFRLDLSPDETTRRRQLAAMAKVRVVRGRAANLRDMLLGSRSIGFAEEQGIRFSASLNPPQQDAVRFALAAKDVAVLHGPPGTGKTTTLAEVIFQAVQRGDKVLACAPSNTAVDNLLEKLAPMVRGAVRVGHPARVFESLRDLTLDELVENDPATVVVRDMKREIEQLVRAANRDMRGKEARRRRRELFAEAGQLRGQVRALERSVIRGILDSANVICTTTTIDDDLLGDRSFDLAVVDEACQCTQPSIWQIVLRSEKLIFAGDHCQLPPTVLSDSASQEGMRESTMQSLVQREGDSIVRLLTVQYRMHQQIMDFSSQQFYRDSLVADASVKEHCLADLDGVADNEITAGPLLLIDTAGAEFHEQVETDGESKLNPKEANLIVYLVNQLMESGVAADQIAVIAPYAAQVRLLRNRLNDGKIEIDTVDGFQGREKEVVLLTMVRSNDRGEIGFLADTRRTNVAMTRAKRKLIVVADSATLAVNDFYRSMLEYFESVDAYQSVWQYSDLW